MELLPVSEYHKLIEPVKSVSINNLFARWIIEEHLPGKIYADDIHDPLTYYVIHPYGMSLLFGNCTNKKFNEEFRNYALNAHGKRDKFEWMQAFPDDWDHVLGDLFKDNMIRSSDNVSGLDVGVIELNTRLNFRFNKQKYSDTRIELNDSNCLILRTTCQSYEDMKGIVVPAGFWESSSQFLEKGIGFSLFYKGELASTAYSAFFLDNRLELGIETREKFRGKGFAYFVCSALIDYCIGNGLEPVWACRLENTPSYRLAQRLGFDKVAEKPYYRLGR